MDRSSKGVAGTSDDIRQSNLCRPLYHSSGGTKVRGPLADCFWLRGIGNFEATLELGPDSNVHLSNRRRDYRNHCN